MGHVATIVSGTTKAGKRDELFALFKQHLAPRAETNPKQPVVVWLADQADANAFHLFEIYSDPAAMEENSKAEWFWAYISIAAPLLDGQPVMKLASPRWAKGVEIG
jgi:quinol monooxygenase YgiN